MSNNSRPQNNNNQQKQQPKRVQHFHNKHKQRVRYVEDGSNNAEQDPNQAANNPPEQQQQQQHNHHHHHHHNHHNHSHQKQPAHAKWVAPQLPEQEEDVDCTICCHRIQVHTVHEKCDHDSICWKCTLTTRILNNEQFCCICKAKSDNIIFTAQPTSKKFADFDLSKLFYDDEYKVYTDNAEILKAIFELRAQRCRICNDTHIYKRMNDLTHHLSQNHGVKYCKYCLQNRKVFLSDQKVYSKKDINTHYTVGEKDENGIIRGHPICKFCNDRHYSDDDLFKHMNSMHQECFICKREGKMYHYFRNTDHLDEHYAKCHFKCMHPDCKLIVFGNEIDLKAHEVKEHLSKGNKKNTKVEINLFSGASSSDANSRNALLQQAAQQQRTRRVADVDSSHITFVDRVSNEFDAEVLARQEGPKHQKTNRKQKQFFKDANGQNRSFEYNGGNSSSNDSLVEQAVSDDQKQKNSQLIKDMKAALQHDKQKFEEFRKISADFQRGAILAGVYYKIFSETFKDKADVLFDALIATMPEKDKMKKDALMLARSTYTSKEFGQREEVTATNEDEEDKKKNKKNKKKQPQPVAVNPDWPTLSGAPSAQVWVPNQQRPASASSGAAKKQQEFPTLGANPTRPVSASSKALTASQWIQSQNQSAAHRQPAAPPAPAPAQPVQQVNNVVAKKSNVITLNKKYY